MADETLFTAEGTNEVIINGPMRPEDFIIRQLNGTAYMGDLVTAASETGDDVDQCASGEEPSGIIVGFPGPGYRPSDTWDADTILPDNTWVKILKIGTGDYRVRLLINGQDTPVVGKDGDPVFSTNTAGSTTDSRDGCATLNTTGGFSAMIGRLAGNFTTGDSDAAGAPNGTYAEVFV